MEYNLKEQPVYYLREVMNTTTQQPVDLDFTLPDYCADMEKILKCTVSVKVFSRTLSAGQLRIEGASLVRILYTDASRKSLRCCEQNVPFSTSLNVTSEIRDYVIRCDAKAEYINCRALTPRRVVVHGAISLNTRILTRDTQSLFVNDEENDLETSLANTQVCQLKLLSQDRFSVNEAVSVNTKKSVETIVRSELISKVTDYRITSGQVTISGELLLSLLYISDAATSDLDRFVTAIPFSQTLRLPDETQDINKVELEVCSFDVILKSDIMNDTPVLAVEANLLATISGYEKQDISFIADAYSTEYDTQLASENMEITTDVKPFDITATTKANLVMGENRIQKVIDIFTDSVRISSSISEDLLKLNVRSNVSVVAVNSEDEIVCIERQVDFTHDHKIENSFSCVDSLRASVVSLSFRLGDSNDMELRMETAISGTLMKNEMISCTTGITALQKSESSENSPLKIYYADEGEDVWEIAKHFKTSVSSLREENNIQCDVLEAPAMLMIVKA